MNSGYCQLMPIKMPEVINKWVQASPVLNPGPAPKLYVLGNLGSPRSLLRARHVCTVGMDDLLLDRTLRQFRYHAI